MRLISFIFCFYFCSISFAQNKNNIIKEGNKLYKDSSYNAAEMKYRKALLKDQNSFEASFNLADAIYKQERYKEAGDLFNALKDNKQSKKRQANVMHNLGNSLLKQQLFKPAIEAYKNALRNNPYDEESRYNLSYAQKQLRKQQENQENQKEENQENQKEENQENQKEENQENQKEENQENQKEENQKNQKEEKEQMNKEENQKNQKEEKEQMNKEDAEKILQALQQQEKELQEKLQKKKRKRIPASKKLKDW